MASFSTWRPLENRVFKTRFTIQKNLKKLQVCTASPHRIGSDQRERESDQREGDQIRERERVRSTRSERERKSSREPAQAARPGARVTQARAAWGSHDPGSRDLGLARPRPPGSRDLGGLIFFQFNLFFFFLMALISFFA